MRLYRLGGSAFPIWDGGGAAAYGGRWNPPGVPVIYAAGTLSLAMLERLVQRRELGNTLMVAADIPPALAIEDLLEHPPPNWRALGSPEAAAAGGEWLTSRRTPLLRVPSALVPVEANYLINPAHPDTPHITVTPPEPLTWDPRLFGVPAPSSIVDI